MSASDPELHFCLDTPTPAAGPLPQRRVLLRGWCFHAGASKVVALHASNSRESQPARLHYDRRDVAAVFNTPAANDSGFSIALRLPPGDSLTLLTATLDDGSSHLLTSLPFFTPREGVFKEYLQLALLRLGTLRGRPRLWARLAQEERDFLLYRADQHGLLSIGRHRQHPPRPLEPETFPAPSSSPPEALPRFDLACPSFNQGAFLSQALLSILSQQNVRLRLHVQDGASTDNSVALLGALEKAYPASPLQHFSWDSRPDSGQAAALNIAFAQLSADAAPTDLMAYLNSDDLLLPGALRFVAEWFARHPRADAVYGHRLILDEAGQQTGRWFTPRRRCDDLRTQDLIPQECLFWRRRAWDRVGGLDPSFRFALDWDLLQRFEAAGLKIVRIPWFLGCFRMHPAQKTQAWMESDGTPEMDLLRTRAHGHPLPDADFRRSMTLGQYDSTRVAAAFRRGRRL